jgi:c-di-GMP-binding flagellar brake protein YcgR
MGSDVLVPKNKKTKDRRRQPRASKQVPLSLKDAEPGIFNEVENISSSGVLCHTAKKLPLMSRVVMKIAIEMPDAFSDDTEAVACQGVVVRSEKRPDEKNNGYETAIFFTRMSETDRGKLERFVDHQIASQFLAVL